MEIIVFILGAVAFGLALEAVVSWFKGIQRSLKGIERALVDITELLKRHCLVDENSVRPAPRNCSGLRGEHDKLCG